MESPILFLIQAWHPCVFPRRSKVRPIIRASWNEQLSKACYIMLYLLWQWKSYGLIMSYNVLYIDQVWGRGFWGLTIHFPIHLASTWRHTLLLTLAARRKALPASLAILPVFTLTNETSSMAGCKRCRMIYIYIWCPPLYLPFLYFYWYLRRFFCIFWGIFFPNVFSDKFGHCYKHTHIHTHTYIYTYTYRYIYILYNT